MQKEAELIGRRFLTGTRVAAQSQFAFFDEEFRFTASAVDCGIEILGFGHLEGRDDIAHIHTLGPGDDAGDDSLLTAPGACRVVGVCVSDDFFGVFGYTGNGRFL